MENNKVERFTTQLLNVNVKKQGEGKITFACDKDAFVRLDELRSMEVPLLFWLEGAEMEKIGMTISSIKSSANGAFQRKFSIDTPESERVKVGELSTLVGNELVICVTIAVEPLPLP